MEYLHERWKDEKEHEDFEEYKTSMLELAQKEYPQFGFVAHHAAKSPFEFVWKAKTGDIYGLRIKGKSMRTLSNVPDGATFFIDPKWPVPITA